MSEVCERVAPENKIVCEYLFTNNTLRECLSCLYSFPEYQKQFSYTDTIKSSPA